jgi:sigma-B regulation protein RsbU (phosphoserine phosphatase)
MTGVPAVFEYQRALDAFRRGASDSDTLLKSMSELISLLDLTTTLSSGSSAAEILDAALLTVLGELGATRGVLLVKGEDALLRVRAARGLPGGAGDETFAVPSQPGVLHRGGAGSAGLLDVLGLEVLCPVMKAGTTLAYLGLGPRQEGAGYGERDLAFLQSVASCAAPPIENGLIHEELRRVNRRLSAKVFQLRNLFEINRELTSSFDEESIKNVVLGTLMGHLLVSRCALFEAVPGGFAFAHGRGLRSPEKLSLLPEVEVLPALASRHRIFRTQELPEGLLREFLEGCRLAWVVPISVAGREQGFFAVGERASGVAFSEEDYEFVLTLGRQALAALESVSLHRIRIQKERQDRELQIAREIQLSLFPRTTPTVRGFELAAESRSCYEVGGDYFDFLPLGGGRVGLVIADVSGKGTPASLLMASVHASLQALAGTARPAELMARLNRFLCHNTQDNKYVTLFYAELDPDLSRLVYVNAGHVPPYLVRARGGRERLTEGGTVLGLLEDAVYPEGALDFEPGDLVAVVTDGATEALSPAEEEFGDERLFDVLEGSSRLRARDTLRAIEAAVAAWTREAGCSDDLTTLIVKARTG